ncbi:hypothetical protein JCM19231_3571 [Vibrio ishigakensis]|uniref:Uncharacterized protein n=1 Tax=Vibrio ishigakensis TaxID=1481914 RepID=A0A0B8NIN2_9VIBR|nr:hypothetical protein JCM19231_3571 [Vibrio ishigakensis]
MKFNRAFSFTLIPLSDRSIPGFATAKIKIHCTYLSAIGSTNP